MNVKIDQNLPDKVIDLLKSAGHDATTVHQQNLSGADDSVIAAHLVQETPALITLDLGFADIRAYPPSDYLGLVVLRSKKQDKQTVLSLVREFIPLLRTEPIVGRLWIVEEGDVRIRGESE